jgi:hypothetical protein
VANAISVGEALTNHSTSASANQTYMVGGAISFAGSDAYLDVFNFRFAGNATGVKVGSFYFVHDTFYWQMRDYESIGNVTGGSNQQFTGKNCTIVTGDRIGYYAATGALEWSTSGGSTSWSISGDKFDATHNQYTADSGGWLCVNGSGYALVAPTVTTQAATDITSNSCTGNGNLTQTDSTVTRRGFCYMAGASGDPTTANSVAYDDGSFSTGAYTKSITGLSPSTAYRVRAYAVNTQGTGYGTTVDVTTSAGGGGTWAVKPLGLSSSVISKVNNIAKASISKFNGKTV